MKGQRIGRQLKRFGDCAGGHPVRAGPNQQPEDVEAVVLREGCESSYGIMFFHISTNIEMYDRKQAIYFALPENIDPNCVVSALTLYNFYLFHYSTIIELNGRIKFRVM